ncbi:MAG TPA: hypothetical protein VN660_13655 [Steroidobacteraceae bacterium]|nr:hypothetical protein [Steroidobacteraceae bacterium]
MAKKEERGDVKARVLRHVHIAGQRHAPNDLVTLPADMADAHAAAGDIDPHPDAVAYAESLKKA